ncbi:hypothetical protein [Nonlabens sp.]|uniref:hypothetical protein n=1 Tax=Nonlabens sp. TaxID=1888209 RepID=UPI00326507DC
MTYQYKKKCNCGHLDTYELTKREAAFNLKDRYVLNQPCSKCLKKNGSVSSVNKPIDKDLLKEWSIKIQLNFCSQDEDLVLAQESQLIHIFIELLNSKETLNEKEVSLIGAMIEMINIEIHKAEKADLDLVNLIFNDLQKRTRLYLNFEMKVLKFIEQYS